MLKARHSSFLRIERFVSGTRRRERDGCDMVGTKEIFTVELLKQTKNKKILEEGPNASGFWVKKKCFKILLREYSCEILEGCIEELVRKEFHLTVSEKVEVRVFYYSDCKTRTSMWAWIFVKGILLHCHVEAAVV